MRIKLFALALLGSLVAVSAAVAGGHLGKGRPSASGADCRPARIILAGTLGADVDPADGDTSFTLTVKRANRAGHAFKRAGTATILVGPRTKIRRQGAHNLGALAPNDRVLVRAKACRADLKASATPDLAAWMIAAHAARASR